MQKKISKISLLLWLGIAVVSSAIVIGGWISDGFDSVRMYVPIPLVAFAMYLFRLFLHKRMK